MTKWSKSFLLLYDELLARQKVIDNDLKRGVDTELAAQSVYVHLLSLKFASDADSPSKGVNALVRAYASVVEDESVEQFNLATDPSNLFVNELAATFKQAETLTKRIFTASNDFSESHR